MTLKIRLRKQGRKNRPCYRLVVTDSRTRRDGRYVESVGWYDPVEPNEDKYLSVKADRVQHWLEQGAQLSDKAEALVAKISPEIVKKKTEREVALRLKKAQKRRKKKPAMQES